jgi:hypothetical protein
MAIRTTTHLSDFLDQPRVAGSVGYANDGAQRMGAVTPQGL